MKIFNWMHKRFHHHHNTPKDEVDIDEENYNSELEELNPLMHSTTFEHNFEDVVYANANKEEVVMNLNEIVLFPPFIISHEVMETKEEENDEKKKKVERITLAELFLADSDVKMKVGLAKVLLPSSEKEKQILKAKHGLSKSFTKKLIPLVKDNPHPIRDIKKLMKMLKRKIHPELDVNNHKAEVQKASGGGVRDNHKHEAKDTTSLLSI